MALVFALLGAACQPGSGSEDPIDPAELPASDINPMPREELREGENLLWGVNEFPSQWNYHHSGGNLATTVDILGGLLPRPFVLDEQGTPHANPDYLLDYSVRTEPRQELTLTLNPEARWSTGDPITWRDYASMAEALSGADHRYQIVSTTGYDRIADVQRGSDEYEVVITFDRPFAEFGSLFHLLLPAEYTESPELFNEGYRDDIPVTAGPFAFDSLDQTARTITVVRNDEWWGDAALLDSVIYRVLDPQAFDGAFLDGGIDAYAMPLESSSYERIESAAGGEIRQSLGPEYRHITLNGESPLLSDVDVRHAIFLGIDRQTIARAALSPIDWPATVLNNRFFFPHQEGYLDTSGEWGEYDPERAAELLDAAGWSDIDDEGIRHRDGEPLSLRFVIPRGHGPAEAEAELVRDMLAEIGVEVVIEGVAGDGLFSDHVIPGNFELVAFNYNNGGYPLAGSLHQWMNAVPDEDGNEQWRSNIARIGSEEIDAAVELALASLDADGEFYDNVNEVDRLLWEAGHTLPLYQRPNLFAVRTDIANLGASGFMTLDPADIGYVPK